MLDAFGRLSIPASAEVLLHAAKGVCLSNYYDGLQVANTWRTTQDISLAIQATWGTVMDNLDGTTQLARFAGPGAWNDADMLEVNAPSSTAISTVRECAHALLSRRLIAY